MNSDRKECRHNKERIQILALLQEVNQQKYELQFEIDYIINQLDDITKFFDQNCNVPFNVPYVILEVVRDKEEKLSEELEKL